MYMCFRRRRPVLIANASNESFDKSVNEKVLLSTHMFKLMGKEIKSF